MKERKIEIMEVCPRDGWQNLPDVIPLEKKKQYIDHMLASGVKYMQICSFVNPKVIPQMADAQEVTRYFLEKYPDRCFNALIPNLRGAQTAVDCGLREVSFVVSASESHNMANVKRTIAQSLAALDEICEKLPQLDVTLSIATSFGCPFEGAVPPEKVLEMVRHGVDIGITKVRVVANKIRDDSDRAFIRSRIPADDLLGFISYNSDVIDADRKGLSPYDCSQQALDEIRAIKARIDQE